MSPVLPQFQCQDVTEEMPEGPFDVILSRYAATWHGVGWRLDRIPSAYGHIFSAKDLSRFDVVCLLSQGFSSFGLVSSYVPSMFELESGTSDLLSLGQHFLASFFIRTVFCLCSMNKLNSSSRTPKNPSPCLSMNSSHGPIDRPTPDSIPRFRRQLLTSRCASTCRGSSATRCWPRWWSACGPGASSLSAPRRDTARVPKNRSYRGGQGASQGFLDIPF